MAEEPQVRLLGFLANVLARIEHDLVTRLELVYAPKGAYRTDPLRTWNRSSAEDIAFFQDDSGKPNHVYTEKLAAEMIELASSWAETYGEGNHRFVVRAHKHLNGYLAHSFLLAPSFHGGDELTLTEGGGSARPLDPTATGIVAQLMRHLETRDRNAERMMQSYIGGMTHHAQQQRDEIDSLREQLGKQIKDRVEWLDAVEAARSQDHQRQIEALTATSREERKSHAAKKIVNLLPVALSHWMQGNKAKKKSDVNGEASGVQVDKSPLALLIGRLFDSLTADQRGEVASALSIEQQILLVEISDVAETGGSALLSTMLHDLASSLLQPQMSAIMTLMTNEQRVMFAQAIGLAQAQASPRSESDAKQEAEAS